MKKLITGSLLALFALTASAPALAHEGKNENKGLRLGANLFRMEDRAERKLADLAERMGDNFVVRGTITNISGSTLTIEVKHQINVPNVTDNSATITVNADTKYTRDKKEMITLADLTVNSQVVITGTVSDTVALAKRVHVIMPAGKAFGEVTAKTDTSITVKNNVTGATTTFTTDADTQVKINGETQTLADVQVGDKGFVKFKTQVSGFLAKMINLFR